MTTEPNQPSTEVEDPTAPPVISEINHFGDEINTPPVVEEKPRETETTSEESSESKDDVTNLIPPNNVRTATNVTQKYPTYQKDTRPPEKRPFSLTMVPKRFHGMEENTAAWRIETSDAQQPENQMYIDRWIYGLNSQLTTSYHADRGFFEKTLDNPNAAWTQGYTSDDGKEVYLRKPSTKRPTERRLLIGAGARERASQSIGMGIVTRVPLPHTGYSVTLMPRSEQDYLDLEYLLTLDKARAGRDTVGMIFQNSHIKLVSRVWEFIRESIKSANRQNFDDLDLGDEIRITDLPILQWGMACTMFPNGYPLDLPCSAGPNICRHVEHVLLDIDKLLWVNSNGLTTSQRAKLAKTHPLSKEEVNDYQQNTVSPFTKVVQVSPTHKIVLKVPTINEYITAGEEWLASMTEAATKIFTGDDNEENVRRYVKRVIDMSGLREYSHWIERIIYDDIDEVEGETEIADNLKILSGDPELLKNTLQAIQEFIEQSTIALIAIPNFACPKCETDYVTDEHSEHPELIPLDMMKHFFMLKDLRLAPHMQSQLD